MEANKEMPSEMQSLNLDTTVSKEVISRITKNMTNIEIYGKIGKLQECLSPTPLGKSSMGSHNNQEAAKESGESRQAIDKTSVVSTKTTDLQNFVYVIWSGQMIFYCSRVRYNKKTS
jgi:hypothetical protein